MTFAGFRDYPESKFNCANNFQQMILEFGEYANPSSVKLSW
jgi:hypothetical protein